MKKAMILGWVLGLFVAGLSGCAGLTIPKPAESEPVYLDVWLEGEAFEQIVQQLRTNSFMKGMPFIIVKTKGEAVGQNISNQIDILTEGIRERLVSLLLEYPEIKVIRRHPVSVLDRPYRLHELKCGDSIGCEMLLVVDIIRFGRIEENMASVNIRAIDLKKDNWITGFSLHKEVALTAEQSRDLNSIHPDEYLRGTKYVPFLESQGAEMAAYLAENLSCICREAYSEQDIKVFVDSSKVKRKHRDIVWFIRKQLQLCNEIQLVNDKESSDSVLVAEARQTGPDTGIGQFWVDVYKRKGGELVKGLATYSCFVIGEERPASVIGRWKILNLPSRSTDGFLEITGVCEGGYQANLFGADGNRLRKPGILIKVSSNNVEWSYYDERLEKTIVVNGILLDDRTKMAVKVKTFPATEMPLEQELVLID